jgi:valyl-tRNA synthetase
MGMLLTSPAGNDLPFDESLCEQGRNFNNKIWNAFRLVESWEIDSYMLPPKESNLAINWFYSLLGKTIIEYNDLFDKYRLSEALMLIYKVFRDEFSSWLLEVIKPPYQQKIDAATIDDAIYLFGMLLKLLHPFMPFITEEVMQLLEYEIDDIDDVRESIMVSRMPEPLLEMMNENWITSFDIVKEIVTNVRTVRLQKNIPNKESIILEVIGEHDDEYNSVICKMGNISEIKKVKEKSDVSISFLVGTTEYSIPVGNNIDVEAELAKLGAELKYFEEFLVSVNNKLSNEKFVANAKPEIVENEKKKLSDAESKIKTLKEQIARFNSKFLRTRGWTILKYITVLS